MGHDHQTGDWRDVPTSSRQLNSDAKWHRDAAARIQKQLDEMTDAHQAAIGIAAVLQQQRDRDLHLQLALELEAYLAADRHQDELF